MNIIIIAFFVGSIFAIGLTMVASAQLTAEEHNIRFAYAESIVRNANGQLVSYIENHRMAVIDVNHLNSILDYEVTLGDADVFATEIDGEVHEWIRMTKPQSFDEPTVRSTTQLGSLVEGSPVIGLSFTHDAYVFDAGDKLTVVWTVVRPFV